MSQTQTQTQTRELTEEEVVEMVKRVLDEGKEEAKLILTIELHNRVSGCGYIYLYRDDVEILEGDADVITLSKSEFNCDVEERIAIIPRSVPVVVKRTYKDDDPEASNYIQYYVFTPSGWKSVKVILPKE